MAQILGLNDWHEESLHFMDVKRDNRYNYHGQLLNKVISPEITANPKHDINYRQIERLIEWLIDSVKRIKLTYAIAVDKNDYDSVN